MNTKLEEKLQELEGNNQFSTDVDLIKALDMIVDCEISKPTSEADMDLVDAAVKFKLAILGADFAKIENYSEKNIEKYLCEFKQKYSDNRKTNRKSKSGKPIKFALIIAAVLTVSVLSIFASNIVFDFDLMDLKTFLGFTKNTKYTDGKFSLIVNDNRKEYLSIEDFVEKENLDGLLLPIGEIEKVSVFNNIDIQKIIFELKTDNSKIIVDNLSTENLSGKSCITIGEYDIFVIEFEHNIQGVMNHNGSCYYIYTTSMERLVNIIYSLKEGKK